MRVYEGVARALIDAGVTEMFGLMGDGNMHYISSFAGERGGTFIAAVHEGGAVSMADGFGRATGRVGVASVTHGPAFTNTATPLTEAARARSSLLVLTSTAPREREHLQRFDIRGLAGATGAAYQQVPGAEDTVEEIERALTRADAERRPVVLDIPADLIAGELTYKAGPRPVPRQQAVVPDEQQLDAALGVAASAKRPIVLAGKGAVRSGARDALLRLAQMLDAPVATTLLAKDYFAGEHGNLGVFGRYSHRVAADTISKSDCILSFGASLNPFTTDRGGFLEGKALVQCDVDHRQLARFVRATVPVVADARALAARMIDELTAAGFSAGSSTVDSVQRELADFAHGAEFKDRSRPGAVDMRTALIHLNDLVPRDRVVVTDLGRFFGAPVRHLEVGISHTYIHTGSFGSIGLGLATAIGVAAGNRARPTVAVVGDGGLMMGMTELSTAVRHRLPLIVVVLNDGAYGMEYTKLEQAGLDAKHALMQWPSLAEVAISLGARAVTWASADDLKVVREAVADGTLPLLIDIRADPAVNIAIT